MVRTCSTNIGRKRDPALRRYTLLSALLFAVAGLAGGFFFGYGIATHNQASNAPVFEKIFLTSFISFSCAAAGLIVGGFIGSTLYRIIRKQGGDYCPPDDE